MLIIKHRINKISQLKKTPIKYGVEIDLRSENKKIYLHHDPYKKGEKFEKWINYYNHNFLVLNVKEEGLEKKIIKIIKKKKIKNYFFHDQSYSSMLKLKKNTKVSIRYSEFEEIKKKKYLFNYIKWIWVDHFNKFSLNRKFYLYLKRNKVNICAVSPELVDIKNKSKIIKFKNNLIKKKINLDAICTKFPILWERK